MTDTYGELLGRLSGVPGVKGALLVEPEAGVLVRAEVDTRTDGHALAALAAALFQRTERAGDLAGLGRLTSFQLDADAGHVVMAMSRDVLLVVLADANAQLGMIRLQTHRAAESLR
jgi:predicted regulator of Ras-like GTPase activity (Roadblock/LC7/MglB family)